MIVLVALAVAIMLAPVCRVGGFCQSAGRAHVVSNGMSRVPRHPAIAATPHHLTYVR
jgi:hypothetical protein